MTQSPTSPSKIDVEGLRAKAEAPDVVWLVGRSSGSYDEYDTEVLAAYATEQEAASHAESAADWWCENIHRPHAELALEGKTGTVDNEALYKLSGRSPFDSGYSSLNERTYHHYSIPFVASQPSTVLALLDRVEALEKALRPFADAADDADRLAGHDGPMGQFIDLERLRHARSTLSGEREE